MFIIRFAGALQGVFYHLPADKIATDTIPASAAGDTNLSQQHCEVGPALATALPRSPPLIIAA
jgi:hypothetical protein